MQSGKKTAEMKEQIAIHLRKKDYYEILGLTKSCSEADIKKAYKKLALRFHPDRNSVEGARDVFKKVSNAYMTLSNAQKREQYDRFGAEEDRQPNPAFARRRYYRNTDDEFQEIFQTFFGMNIPRRNNTTYYRPRQPNQQNAQNAGQQPQQGFNFFHVLLLLSVLYLIPLMFRDKPLYSFTQDSEYRIKSTSQTFQINFFVRPDIAQKLKSSSRYRKQVFEKVEKQYLLTLHQQCQVAEQTRRKFELQAYHYAPGGERQRLLQRRNRVDMASCRAFTHFRDNHPQYVRKLLY